MPYTDEELMALYGGLSEAQAPASTPGVEWKTPKQIVNIIPKALNLLGQSATHLGQLVDPDSFTPEYLAAAKDPLPTFDVGPNEGIKDVLLNNVAPEVASWIVPYLGITKGARAVAGAGRLASILTEGVAQGASNFISTERYADEQPGTSLNPLNSGIMGTASGILQMALPRWQRALPLAAVSALAYAKSGNAWEAGGNFLGNMLPGAWKAITTPTVNTKGMADVAEAINVTQGPGGSMIARHSAPIPGAPLESPFQGGMFSFMDEVHSNFPKEVPEVSTPEMRLAPPTHPELNLTYPEPPTPRTSVADLPRSFPRNEAPNILPTNDAGLALEGQSMKQTEFPLIKLQSEGRLNPEGPKFELVDAPSAPTKTDPDLFNWRNEAVNRKGPPQIENVKGGTPVEVSSSVAPEPSATKVARAKDFETTGIYDVTLKNGTKHQMFRDPENGWWYRQEAPGEKQIHHSERVIGFNKKEAIARLEENFGGVKAATEEVAPLEIMTGDGFLDVQPRMEGPHVISTLVKDNDTGALFAGKDWKNSHKDIKAQDPEGLLSTKFDLPGEAGEAEHMFLVKDKKGIVRPASREEAGEIADLAKQRDKDYNGYPLQSEHLAETPTKPLEPPTPTQIIAAEKAKDASDMGALEASLRQNLEKAKASNDMLGIRIANRKLQEFLVEAKPAEAVEREAAVVAKGKSGADAFSPEMATTAKDSTRRFMARYSNESGAVNPEVLALVSLAGIGGLFAYNKSKGDIGTTLATAAILLGLGASGSKAFQLLKEVRGPEVKIDMTPVGQVKGAAAKLTQLAIETSHTPAGLAVGGRAGVWAHANNMVEGLLGLNQIEAFKSAKVKADGFIAARVEELSKAFDSVKGFQPTQAFQQAEAQFLRGQLANPIAVQQILNSGRAVTADAFHTMTAANRAAFPEKWMVLADPLSTNTKGAGVEIWHVSNTTKQALMQAQRDALLARATNPTDLAYMPYSLKFREVVDNIMSMYHDALPPGANRNRLVGTQGQYITRSHAVITDPKAYPTPAEFDNAVQRLGILKEGEFLKNVEAMQTASATHNTAVTWNGTTYYMTPRDAMDFKYLHSPESLRGEVRDYIKEIKQRASMKNIGAIDPDSEQFTSALFTGRKELDEVTQALLGTHKMPSEMMQATLDKVIPAGQAGAFMKDAVRAIDPRTGMKSALNATEYNQAIEAARIGMAAGDVGAKNAYRELLSYTKSSANDKFGLTADMYISRGLNERMQGFDGTAFGFLDNPIGKGLRSFNSFFKTTHLALSPASIMRQIVQAPMMMAMGGVRDISAVVNGYKGYMDRSSDIGKWMNEWGVFSASAKHGDFNHTLAEVLSGQMDKTIWSKIQRGVAKAHGAFSAGDDITRASVFMNEAQRAAKELGVPLDSMHLDPRVGQRAQSFMLRRSMDFSNLPNYVKLGREIPFVNIFLAYTHEIARVALNTAKDAAKGDLQAGATLAGLATVPFILQRQAEASLSPADRAAWKRAQNVVPAYSRPRFKLPLGRNKDGSFNYLDITSVLPFNDYQMVARSALRGDGEALALVNPLIGLDNSPIFNVAGPQIAGRDFHTQREFRDVGDRAKNAIQQLLPGWTPGIGLEYTKSMPEELGGQLGVTNLKNARTNTSIGAWLRNTTGIDYTQIHPNIATKNYIASAKSDIATERAYLKDVLKTANLSVDAKRRAEERFVESVKHITQNLQLRLQLQTPQ
jgi:hypothetical protein